MTLSRAMRFAVIVMLLHFVEAQRSISWRPDRERCNPEHSFQCRDGSCIPKEYQCNRQTDCRGGEDEYNCPCSSDEFQCNDGTCIESRKQCDRRYDCRDRSDEENCTPDVTNNTWSGAYVCQSRFQFMCGDGSCISIMKRCDGSVDCPKDSADESGCPCKPDQWQCDYGSCISQTKKCDGFVDCPIDRSDERFCFEVPEECSDEDFRCNSGSCIPSYLRCDRNADCDDGSDEYDCPSESDRQCADYQFRCNDGTCISDYMKCDKNPDCRDGSDEADCAPLEGSCDIRCGDGKCLDASKRCNEFVDCNDGIDEKDCQICEADQFRCNDGSCISIDKQCDRVQDCGDGSDEYDCPSTGYECKDGDFDCIGSCIPMSRRCDRFEDCPNGTDEIDCGREMPVVEIYPSNRTVIRGQRIELQCRISRGIPPPEIFWTRLNRPLSPDSHLQPNGILVINNFDVNDEGEYICSASNAAGEHSAHTYIKMITEPQIEIYPQEKIKVRSGQNIDVECRATGTPEPVVYWKKIYPDEIIKTAQSYSPLYMNFNNIQSEDGGTYACIGSNDAGEVEARVTISYEDTWRGDIPEVDTNTAETTNHAIVGEKVELRCDHPSGTVFWVRQDDRRLPATSRQEGNVLNLYNVSKADSGNYECVVMSHDIVIFRTSILVVVRQLPQITLDPQTQTVRPGDNAYLECIVTGDEPLTVTWIPINGSFPSHVQQKNRRLEFNGITVEDAGLYICTARNPVGEAEGVGEVIVGGPVMNSIEISPNQKTVREGEDIVVSCRTRGQNFDVRWSKESSNERLNTIHARGGLDLIIKGVTTRDSGNYRCDGRDRNGTPYNEDFTLTVVADNRRSVSYPDMQQDEPEVHQAALGTNVHMPCKTNMPAPVRFQWERPYAKLTTDEHVESVDEPVLVLKSIDESHAGPYTCKTSNGESNSERKIILKVTHVVPRFEGSGYIELPKWDDTFYYFDMDIAIRPEDPNGIIFYESHLRGKNSGDFITLTLNDGVPEFTFMFQTLPTTIRADRPISMNEWHIINISRIRKNAYMKVDDRGPFPGEGIGVFEGLELEEPMYIGGVPEYEEINDAIKIRKGFTGCIGRLVLDKTDISLMKAGRDKVNILECNSCLPNPCKNKAICQDASTDRGYSCLCPDGFSGIDCSLTGDACRTGLCGKGKCEDTRDGFKCICPIGYIGDRCDTRLDVEYPAFGGEAYIAYAAPKSARLLNMGLRIKPNYPMRDGLILYCAESRLGEGHFTSLAVKDRYLEFRYGIGSSPVVIRSQKPLVADEWVNVNASRFGQKGKLEVEGQETMTMSPPGTSKKLNLNTALYVGGYDEKYMTINKGTGVENGFKGCIADVIIQGSILSIVNNSIESSNIRKCDGSTHTNDSGRGDIPPDMTESSEEEESVCSQCKNGGWCRDSHATQCECRDGYTGKYCEYQQQPINTYNHCDHLPCQGNGTCRPLRDGLFKCDCPLGTGGFNCQNRVELGEDCSLTGEGYVELPASLLPHNSGLNSEFMAISFTTSEPDGLLILQGEEGKHYRDGDFMLLNINQGLVEFEWNLGEGVAKIANSRVHVSNGERHNIIVKRTGSEAMLEVDGVEDIGRGPGLTQTLNANSNIFIGGTPSHMTASGLIGFSGCIHQIEFPEANAVNIGRVAVASRNANPCSNDEDNTVELIEAQ